MFKTNKKNTRTTSLTSGVFIVNIENISHLFLLLLSLTLSMKMLVGLSLRGSYIKFFNVYFQNEEKVAI